MRNRSFILLSVALICGLIASLGVTRALSKRSSPPGGAALEMVPILVAAQDIPMGDPITPEFLRSEPWPKHKIPRGAITDVQKVLGRRPKTRIYANTPILENQLLAKGESTVDPTEHIPPGYRVVSVQVDEVIGAGRLIRPGDRVDILVFIQRNLARGIPETITRTILQDVKVFAVGDQFDLQTVEKKPSITARSVSLLVTPRQAEILMLATELGSIRLSLRSHADGGVMELPGSSPRDLGAVAVDSPPSTPPSPPAAPLPVVSAVPSLPASSPESEPSPKDSWVVRLIEGSRLREVKLVALPGPDDSSGSSRPEELAWHIEDAEAPEASGRLEEGFAYQDQSSGQPTSQDQPADDHTPDRTLSVPDDASPTDSGVL